MSISTAQVTKTIYVDVRARVPGSSFYTDVSGIDGVLRPGQTDCQVRIKVDSLQGWLSGDVQIPLKVTTRPGSFEGYETITYYPRQALIACKIVFLELESGDSALFPPKTNKLRQTGALRIRQGVVNVT